MTLAPTVADAATFAGLTSTLKKSKQEKRKYTQKFGDYQRRTAKRRCLSFNIDEYSDYLTGLERRKNAETKEYQWCLYFAKERRLRFDQQKWQKHRVVLKDARMHHLWQISMVVRHLFRTEVGAKKSDQCGYFIDTVMNRIIHKYCYHIQYHQNSLIVQDDTYAALALAISDDGRYLFVAGANKLIKVWDLVSNTMIAQLKGHFGSIQCLDYRFGTLVSGGNDYTVIIWDAFQLKMTRTLVGHTNSVLSANFNPTGDQIVSGSKDMTVLLWSVATGQCLKHFIGHRSSVFSAHFLGKQLISGSSDRTVKVWNRFDATDHRTIADHSASRFTDVRINCDSTLVACIAEDHSVMILSLPGLKKVRTINEPSFQCRFHPFIPYVLAMGMGDTYSVKLYDIKRGRCLSCFEGHASFVANLCFSPDGTRLFSSSGDRSVRLHDLVESFGGDISLTEYEKLNSVDYPKYDQTLNGNEDWIMCAVISTDGRRLFTGSVDGCITEWDLVGLKVIKQWSDNSETVRCMDYCNRLLVSGSGDGMIKIWSINEGKLIHSIKAHMSALNRVIFNEDATEVYSCSDDMNIRRLAISKGITTLTTYKGHRGGVESLVYLPQSKMLISDSLDDSFKVRDLRDGHSTVKTFRTPHGSINDMCMNGNESLLACITSDAIHFYSWPDFKHRKLCDCEPTAAQFHPFHYHILAVGYSDGRIRVFDTNSRSLIHEFADESKDLQCRVEQVCFTPNGQRLLSVGLGNAPKMWNFDQIGW